MNKILIRFAINYINIDKNNCVKKEARIKYLEGFLKGKGY